MSGRTFDRKTLEEIRLMAVERVREGEPAAKVIEAYGFNRTTIYKWLCCRKPVHLVLDSLPAHKTALVKKYVASTEGRLTLHFLPGYAPDLNPDELVWSHVKRTGTARRPL